MGHEVNELMAGRHKPPDSLESKRIIDKPLRAIADAAATAAVRISMEGRNPGEKEIWKEVRHNTDQLAVPTYFCEVLKSPTFLTLVDIRLKRATLTSLEDVVFLRNTVRDVLMLAADSVLEDLIIQPELLSTRDRIKLITDFSALYETMVPKGQAQAALVETPEAAAIEQAAEMEETLSKLPPALRERTIRQWKLERMKELNDVETKMRGDGQDTVQTGE